MLPQGWSGCCPEVAKYRCQQGPWPEDLYPEVGRGETTEEF